MSVPLVPIIVVASVSMKLDHFIVSVYQMKICYLMDLIAQVSSNLKRQILYILLQEELLLTSPEM